MLLKQKKPLPRQNSFRNHKIRVIFLPFLNCEVARVFEILPLGRLWPRLNIKTVFPGSRDRLIFNMGIPILSGKTTSLYWDPGASVFYYWLMTFRQNGQFYRRSSKCVQFWINFIKLCSHHTDDPLFNIGFDTDLQPNRRKTITWNYGSWCHGYGAISDQELTNIKRLDAYIWIPRCNELTNLGLI